MNRRKRALKRKIYMMIVMFILIAIGIFMIPFTHFRVAASEKNNPQPEYMTYVVKRGDTLWGLADTYMGENFSNHQAYISDVMRANGMNQAYIYVGQLLIIPYEADTIQTDHTQVAAVKENTQNTQ